MSKASKIQRSELYKDHLVQVFLSKFLTGEIGILEPIFDPNKGYRYPLVEAILGNSEVQDFLSRLTEAGILNSELYDKIVFCPHCGSPKISIHYNCPHCRSFNVEKSALIEHLQCGYIDTEDKFKKGDGLTCPKCDREMIKLNIDYNKAGIWCTCTNCQKSFDIPVPSHFCRGCHKNSTFEDAIYKEAYAYRVSNETKKEASLGWILVAPVRDFLERHGFSVETPGFLKGKSGANHMFDITAFRDDQGKDVTVIDLATSEKGISEQPVIAMFAKIYDVSPSNACLIAIPRITENGRKMAKLYNIKLVEAKSPKEAMKVLERVCVKQEAKQA